MIQYLQEIDRKEIYHSLFLNVIAYDNKNERETRGEGEKVTGKERRGQRRGIDAAKI